MSQENVVLVRRYVAALEAAIADYWREPRSAAAAMEVSDLAPKGREEVLGQVLRYLDPDVEWNTAFAGVSFRGHLGCAQGWDWLTEAADHYAVTVEEITELSDGRVLLVLDRTLKAKGSGVELD